MKNLLDFMWYLYITEENMINIVIVIQMYTVRLFHNPLNSNHRVMLEVWTDTERYAVHCDNRIDFYVLIIESGWQEIEEKHIPKKIIAVLEQAIIQFQERLLVKE